MCVKLGRMLRSNEHVDHIDNDKTNDSIDNLQILSRKENLRKYADTLTSKPRVKYICPFCQKVFDTRHGNSHLVNSKKFELKTCSHSCSSNLQKLRLSKEEKYLINEKSIIKE